MSVAWMDASKVSSMVVLKADLMEKTLAEMKECLRAFEMVPSMVALMVASKESLMVVQLAAPKAASSALLEAEMKVV